MNITDPTSIMRSAGAICYNPCETRPQKGSATVARKADGTGCSTCRIIGWISASGTPKSSTAKRAWYSGSDIMPPATTIAARLHPCFTSNRDSYRHVMPTLEDAIERQHTTVEGNPRLGEDQNLISERVDTGLAYQLPTACSRGRYPRAEWMSAGCSCPQ